MAFTKAEQKTEIEVLKVESDGILVEVISNTPLIYNCMSEKARRELLFPETKTRATRATRLKHDPLHEYRNSVYRIREDNAPTLLGMPITAFKGAMESAAGRIPGVYKEDVKQLVSINAPELYGNLVPIYGVPQILMSVVRSAGMQKTPDIRTRAIVPTWACKIEVRYIRPQFGPQAIMNLISAAGVFVGIGDFRQEKGAGNYGLFRVNGPGDVQFKERSAARNGRAAQLAALERPVSYDAETESLLSWFETEVVKRDKQKQLTKHEGNGTAPAELVATKKTKARRMQA